jgi:uncharacterized protein (TIGR02391 family)
MKVKDLLNETQEFSKFCNHLYILCKNINHDHDDDTLVIIGNMYITILNFFRVKKKPKFMTHVEKLNYIRNQLLTWEVKFHQLKPYYRGIKSSGLLYGYAENLLKFEERKWEYGIISYQMHSISITISELNKVIALLVSMNPEQEIVLNTVNKVGDNKYSYLNHLHPEIKKYCVQLFLDGHYSQSIEAAVKTVNGYIKKKVGSSLVHIHKLDGDGLYTEVFSSSKPILSFSGLSSIDKNEHPTLYNEQQGFMTLLQGFSRGVRNVLAHNIVEDENPQKAFEYLVMASLFCRRIDDTKKVNR